MLPYPSLDILPTPAFKLDDDHAAEIAAKKAAIAAEKKRKEEAARPLTPKELSDKVYGIKPTPSYKVEEAAKQ